MCFGENKKKTTFFWRCVSLLLLIISSAAKEIYAALNEIQVTGPYKVQLGDKGSNKDMGRGVVLWDGFCVLFSLISASELKETPSRNG